MFRPHLFFALCILSLCAFIAPISHAQDTIDFDDIQKQVKAKQMELDALEPTLLDSTLNDQELSETRRSVKDIRTYFDSIKDQISPIEANIRADIADIGPPPAEDSTDIEPENIKELRERLNKEALMVQGILTQADALSAKSTRFLERLAAIRRGQFVEKILQNYTSPFNAALWAEASKDKDLVISAVVNSWEKGLESNTPEQQQKITRGVIFSLISFLCIFLTTAMVNTRLVRRYVQTNENSTLNERLAFCGRSIIYTTLAGFAGASIIYLSLQSTKVIGEYNKEYIHTLFNYGTFVIFGLVQSWLLLNGRTLRRVICILAFFSTMLFAVDLFILETGQYYGVPIELAIAQSFIVTTIFAVLVLSFLIRRLRQKDVAGSTLLIKRRMFYLGICLALLILGANGLGYVALTRFIFEQSIMLFHFGIGVLILRAMIYPALQWLEKQFYQNPDKDDHLMLFWMSLLVDMTLIVCSLPFIAAIVGVEWEGIRLLTYQAISGFEVGGITISISNLASSIVMFFSLLFFTRFIQKILSEKILPRTRMDKSARISFVQIIGYVGLTIALMSSIAAVGFDLSNLALIAGALSVGIGFGLQSIVSNFVSGLILLFERPIKVGDWVIVNSGEGIVKKISVRATEIETFDRTAIIIPNSELISSSVKNWTHKDRIGRVVISVGVSYNADPHQVKKILLEVASENDYVLSSPLPTVIFRDMADSALIMELRVFIRNISDFHAISSELRFGVWDALKENEIEIPFPQRDLHIRSTEGLEGLFGAPKKPKAAPKPKAAEKKKDDAE